MERAVEIVEGCKAGGITCLEISYTNNNAGEIIKQLKEIYQDEIVVGAGTVLDSETARDAILHGAEFIISPAFSKAVAQISNRYQISYMPGCTSISEVLEALEAGADMIKAFPTSSLHGPGSSQQSKHHCRLSRSYLQGRFFDKCYRMVECWCRMYGSRNIIDKRFASRNCKECGTIAQRNRHICELTKRERVMIDQRTLQLIQKMIQNH